MRLGITIRAAAQHREAAKLHVTSDFKKAREHARRAAIHGRDAKDSCRRATEREGETNEQYAANTKKMYLHQRYSL